MITFVRTYTRDICDYVLMNMNCLKDHMVIFIKYQIFPKQQKIQIKHRCSYIRCFVVGHGVMETLKYVIIAHIKCLLLTDKIKSLNKSKNFNYIGIIPIFASCSFECYCMNIPNIRHMSICIYLFEFYLIGQKMLYVFMVSVCMTERGGKNQKVYHVEVIFLMVKYNFKKLQKNESKWLSVRSSI